MRPLRPLFLRDAAAIPHSFELFYGATVMRTLAAVLRTTSQRHVAHRATQHAYTVMLTRWRDQKARALPENARYVTALAVRAAVGLSSRDDGPGNPFRAGGRAEPAGQPELGWFDVREGLRELAATADPTWPPPSDVPFSALVANGDRWWREPIAGWLRRMGASAVHETATVAEARACARATGPCDLAIIDVDLPDGSGIELVGDLRGHSWRRIVMLTSPGDRHSVPLAFQAGAQACLLKAPAPGEDYRWDAGPPGPALASSRKASVLSTREVEVLQLVAAGQSNREIGQTLNLSALTVKSHLSRIGRKLGVGDRTRMVVHAMRARIIR